MRKGKAINDGRRRAARLFVLPLCCAALLPFVGRLHLLRAAPPPSGGAAAGAAGAVAGNPFVITRGGTYRGTWESRDRRVPAVTVATDEPVVIENAVIRATGDLIATRADHANLTVRNTRGYGLNPGALGKAPGRFVSAENFDSITVANNSLEHTAGIYLNEYGGRHLPGQTVQVLANRAHDVDGRLSDGRGGWLDFNSRTPAAGGAREDGFLEVQFVQVAHVRHLAGIEIAWNEVVNDPGDSRVEDNVSVYLSSGTPDSPIRIHDNFVQGAYTIRPEQADRADDRFRYDWSYSGGGIMLADGSAAAPEDACAYVEAYDNQVLDTSNYGIAISAGHDCRFHDNRVISAGVLPDGRPIAAQNVGAYVWDAHHDARRTPPTFFRNGGSNNLVGWVRPPDRNDWWRPDAAVWSGNRHWPGPLERAAYAAEWELWKKKAAAAHVNAGPVG